MTRRLARTRRSTVVASLVLLAFAATAVGAGASTLVGTATVTTPDGKLLSSGGSAQVFTLELPRGAACRGPRREGSVVYSYLVPVGTVVTNVTFSSIPSRGFGLVDAPSGKYYARKHTEPSTGRVRSLPNFEWARTFGPNGRAPTKGHLLYSGSSGTWDGGIACVDSTGHVTDSWNVRVMFLANHADANGFSWCVVPGVPSELPETPYAAMLPLVGLVAVAGYVAVRRRRGNHRRAASNVSS